MIYDNIFFSQQINKFDPLKIEEGKMLSLKKMNDKHK